MPEGHSEVILPSSEAAGARTVLREVQEALGIPWVPDTWVELVSMQPEAASVLWTRLRPVTASSAFLRESLALLSYAFADLADQYGSGEGVLLPEGDRRGILLDLDALLYGNAQLLLQSTMLRLALRDEAVGRTGQVSARPRSAYRRRVLEAVDESAAPSDVQRLFEDVAETMNLPGVPVDVRVLAKWMGFLEPVWLRLKRWRAEHAFFEACGVLERRAEAAARRVSPAVSVDDRELRVALGGGPERFEWLERLVEIHSAMWPSIIIMDAFFRTEAAIHPEHSARARFPDDAQRV